MGNRQPASAGGIPLFGLKLSVIGLALVSPGLLKQEAADPVSSKWLSGHGHLYQRKRAGWGMDGIAERRILPITWSGANLTMTTTASPCRTYIVYHHGLFAQGVRSVLETQRAVQIVGMESDVGKALKAVQSLKPEVIIVEECTGKHQPMRLGAFLHSATGGRVVTLSLDDDSATVYQRNRMAATDPADLVKAIQGVGKPHFPGPDRAHRKASMFFKTESTFNSGDGLSGSKPRVRSTNTQGVQAADKPPRASRGSRKGG